MLVFQHFFQDVLNNQDCDIRAAHRIHSPFNTHAEIAW